MTYSVGTTTGQTYLPGLTTALTSIVSANLVVNGGAYLPVQERIYASGNWTRPANPVQIANWIKVTCIGGGGSGGSGSSWGNAGSGGGGAGQYLTRYVNITSVAAGGTIPVTVGIGGASVTGNTNGNNGGNTTFGVNGNPYNLIAYGGGGGGYTRDWGREPNTGTCGAGANSITGSGSGGGGGGFWQHEYCAGGGGGGANGPGHPGTSGVRTSGTFYIGYPGGRGYGFGSSSGAQGCSNSWGTVHTHGGRGGQGINGLAGGGGGGGGNGGPGASGAGNGGDQIRTNEGQPGRDGTGSGGGGGQAGSSRGGKGGDGLIIVEYYRRIS
jgi:hypothetical protein